MIYLRICHYCELVRGEDSKNLTMKARNDQELFISKGRQGQNTQEPELEEVFNGFTEKPVRPFQTC